MAKKIIPKKMIIEMNEDGSFKTGIVQYQIAVNGVRVPQYYTMGVAEWFSKNVVEGVLAVAKGNIELGEKITKSAVVIEGISFKKKISPIKEIQT